MGFLRDLTKQIRKVDPLTDYVAKITTGAPGTPGSLGPAALVGGGGGARGPAASAAALASADAAGVLAAADAASATARERADRVNFEERRRRQVLFSLINPTGGAGDLSQANLASRSLLGVG